MTELPVQQVQDARKIACSGTPALRLSRTRTVTCSKATSGRLLSRCAYGSCSGPAHRLSAASPHASGATRNCAGRFRAGHLPWSWPATDATAGPGPNLNVDLTQG